MEPLDISTNVNLLTGVGLIAGVLFSFVKGTELYRSHTRGVAGAVAGLAEKWVAWQWHNHLREATDKAKAQGTTVPTEVQQRAHRNAVAGIVSDAVKTSLANAPAIVAALNGDTRDLDVEVVKAVKRFNTGHTGPSTKGQ